MRGSLFRLKTKKTEFNQFFLDKRVALMMELYQLPRLMLINVASQSFMQVNYNFQSEFDLRGATTYVA